MQLLQFSHLEPSYQSICYEEFHSIELRFRKILEERDDRFAQILECKDKKIDELIQTNKKLSKKLDEIKSQFF